MSETTALQVISPGRINLIGEHIDYSGGHVLPAAIDLHISLELRTTTGTECLIESLDLKEQFSFDLENVVPSQSPWQNYFLCVIHFIQQLRPRKIRGFQCRLKSTLPIGSGMSSSAALECGLAKGLNKLFDLQLTDIQMVEASRDAEHHFVGTKCGIMDQFAVVKGKKENFILLNCDSLNFDYIPAQFGRYDLLLINSNVSHNLAESEYNKRREELTEGFDLIKKDYPEFKNPVDLSLQVIDRYKDQLSEKVYNRLAYSTAENIRTLKAAEYLRQGAIDNVGNLLFQSHAGLKDLYEVSCPELDFLVNQALANEHVLGARMMGGGFGGCVIHLMDREKRDDYFQDVSERYYQQFGIKATAYKVSVSDGVNVSTYD